MTIRKAPTSLKVMMFSVIPQKLILLAGVEPSQPNAIEVAISYVEFFVTRKRDQVCMR